MRRLRYLFAIVAVTLIATIGLLVQKSLQSLAFEQQVRQQVVAERMFDEMERTLSRLLESEEQRPIENYQGAAATGAEPFVVSRFEIDARAEISARREKAEPAHDDGAKLDADLFRQLREPAAPAAVGAAEKRQAPGTTVRLRDARKEAPAAADAAPEGKESSAVSEYDALRALNKAVEDRAGRRHSQTAPVTTGADDVAAFQTENAAKVGAVAALDGDLARARMSGRAVSSDRVVLFRTVAREGALYHQGVVMDVTALGRWLVTEAIGGDGLAQFASLAFFTEAIGSPPVAVDASTYVHRFAAPFADISARLRLHPLATRGSEFYIYALSALLLALTVLSLGFLYRMVAVTVRFAERRANFVAAVSHELKTPLTAIRMYGEMLRDGVVPSEAKRNEYYRHITDESERLSRLINNVLEHAKLEKGNGGGVTTETSLAPVMEDVAHMMQAHAAEHGFDLRVEVAADLPAVRCEVDALKQVLWNLVDNAIKYAATATDRRVILRGDRDGDRVRISVRDGGPGVDARHLPHIFEPFFRGHPERTRAAKGAGLGLALVRGLVERMGATVRGRNADGGGFVVEIWFPAVDK